MIDNNVVIKTDEETVIKKEEPKVIPKVEEKKKKVEVDADVLSKIMEEMSDLRKQVNQVESTSSQDQVRKLEALRATGKLVKSVKIRSYLRDGIEIMVLGWKTVRDDVWVADGKLHENQIIGVFFADGKEKETPLAEFTRNTKYYSYEVIKEGRLNNGEVEFTVILNDGKEVTINSKFVN